MPSSAALIECAKNRRRRLDALVAAPEHHTLCLKMRPFACWTPEFHRAGGRQFMRTVGHSVLYIISWSDFVRRDAEGLTTLDSRSMPKLSKPTSTLWSPPLPAHSLET